jgi:chromosome segregation ATPase
MNHAVRPILFALTLFAAALAGATHLRASRYGGQAIGAQPQTSPQDVLGGILTEVRGLRIALEQMASAAPRVQLALGRLQLQEQRVAELRVRLEGTKQSLAATLQQQEMYQQQNKNMEERLVGVGPDAEKIRAEIEEAARHMKIEGRRIDLEIQRLQTEEASLLQELQTEQGRWAELNQRLEEVERSLGRR